MQRIRRGGSEEGEVGGFGGGVVDECAGRRSDIQWDCVGESSDVGRGVEAGGGRKRDIGG